MTHRHHSHTASRLVTGLLPLAFLVGLTGCLTAAERQPTDAPRAFTHAEVRGILAFVNDVDTTAEVLAVDCALPPELTRSLPAARPIESLDALAALPGSRPWTLDWIATCADRLGFIPTAAEMTLLSFLNDPSRATFETLDHGCGLRSDTAANLLAHRDGPDGKAGTADDDLFDDLVELRGVEMVGPVSVAKLTECAERLGPAPAGAPAHEPSPAID